MPVLSTTCYASTGLASNLHRRVPHTWVKYGEAATIAVWPLTPPPPLFPLMDTVGPGEVAGGRKTFLLRFSASQFTPATKPSAVLDWLRGFYNYPQCSEGCARPSSYDIRDCRVYNGEKLPVFRRGFFCTVDSAFIYGALLLRGKIFDEYRYIDKGVACFCPREYLAMSSEA